MAPAHHHLPPLEVGPDTFLLRSVHPVAGAPLSLYVNSLVIRGPEPVVVDTGARADRDAWLADLRSLVEPAAVRWVILSHDGDDHCGNLAPLLGACPDAVVVTCWNGLRGDRHESVPAARQRWVGEAAVLDVGDRLLRLVRPPVYASPASRAVFDPLTGVLWASDTFATPMPVRPVCSVDELSPLLWSEGMALLHHRALAPWLAIVDRRAYAEQVDRLRALDAAVVVSAHAPVIRGGSVATAFDHLAALPDTVPPPHPAGPDGGAGVRRCGPPQ